MEHSPRKVRVQHICAGLLAWFGDSICSLWVNPFNMFYILLYLFGPSNKSKFSDSSCRSNLIRRLAALPEAANGRDPLPTLAKYDLELADVHEHIGVVNMQGSSI